MFGRTAARSVRDDDVLARWGSRARLAQRECELTCDPVDADKATSTHLGRGNDASRM